MDFCADSALHRNRFASLPHRSMCSVSLGCTSYPLASLAQSGSLSLAGALETGLGCARGRVTCHCPSTTVAPVPSWCLSRDVLAQTFQNLLSRMRARNGSAQPQRQRSVGYIHRQSTEAETCCRVSAPCLLLQLLYPLAALGLRRGTRGGLLPGFRHAPSSTSTPALYAEPSWAVQPRLLSDALCHPVLSLPCKATRMSASSVPCRAQRPQSRRWHQRRGRAERHQVDRSWVLSLGVRSRCPLTVP